MFSPTRASQLTDSRLLHGGLDPPLDRKDTISDLVLVGLFNVVLVGLVAAIANALHFSDMLSLYTIGQILIGQDLPEESSINFTEQVFVAAVGVFGLSSFAVVLALVEQAVLEILEANVRQGSPVIETGHVVLLSWGTSNRDLAQTVRILKEICASQQYSWIKDGQLSIVVLSQGREKLEMESLFDRALPESERAGCRLVFRKGSPLDPTALDIVSVETAKTVIISGDYSARCRESDAQVLRSAILVDEMLQSALQSGNRRGNPMIVIEMQTREGRELCNDTCSEFVRPVPTTTINAMRTARTSSRSVARHHAWRGIRLLLSSRAPLLPSLTHSIVRSSVLPFQGYFGTPRQVSCPTLCLTTTRRALSGCVPTRTGDTMA